MGEDTGNVIEHPRKPLQDRMPREQVKPFKFQSMMALAREQKQVDWLIKGVVERGTHMMLFGDPECGKTLVLFDMLFCVATGREWRGNRVQQGAVFYLCGEGAGGMGRRAAAWCIENGVSLDADIDIHTSETPAALLDANSAQAVCESIKAMCEEHGVIPAAVAIDTLARNFGGGDENSAKDIGQFVAHIDQYLIHELGCAVLTSHHTGHGTKDRARGSMSLPGALDTQYQVQKEETKDGHAIVMTCKKSKDFGRLEPQTMRLMVHDLGYQDEDGDPITGATVRHDPEFKHTIKSSRSMGQPQKFCYDILCQLYDDARTRLNKMGQEHADVKLDLGEWRKQCTLRRAGPNIAVGTPKWETCSKYVYKATKALIDSGVVKYREYGPFIYPSGAK